MFRIVRNLWISEIRIRKTRHGTVKTAPRIHRPIWVTIAASLVIFTLGSIGGYALKTL
jgi:hypothetical protein